MVLRSWVDWLWSDSVTEYRWILVTGLFLAAGVALTVVGGPGSVAWTIAGMLFVIGILVPFAAIMVLGVLAARELYKS